MHCEPAFYIETSYSKGKKNKFHPIQKPLREIDFRALWTVKMKGNWRRIFWILNRLIARKKPPSSILILPSCPQAIRHTTIFISRYNGYLNTVEVVLCIYAFPYMRKNYDLARGGGTAAMSGDFQVNKILNIT